MYTKEEKVKYKKFNYHQFRLKLLDCYFEDYDCKIDDGGFLIYEEQYSYDLSEFIDNHLDHWYDHEEIKEFKANYRKYIHSKSSLYNLINDSDLVGNTLF